MTASLRPLTTGQLLDRTFQTYRQNFILFAGIASLPHVFLLVLQLAALALRHGPAGDLLANGIVAVVMGIGFLLVQLVVPAVSTAATTFGVSDIHLDKPTSIASCFARVKGLVTRVVLTTLGFVIALGVGFVLLIVPGIYVAGRYGLCLPAVVLEDLKPRRAYARSAELTKGAVGRIVVIYFLTWVLTFAVAMMFGVVVAALAPSLAKTAGTVPATIFNHVLSAVVAILVTPVMSIALTLAYYDQRVRKEAFDIENLMAMLGEPAADATLTSTTAPR